MQRGPSRPTSVRARTCVGCRTERDSVELLRFRRRRDGQVVAAIGPREAAGRGAWLCPRSSCFSSAERQRSFGRAFATRHHQADGHGQAGGHGKPSVLEAHFDPRQAWTDLEARLRSEIELLDRSAANPHEHPRRRALARLVVELTSQPAPPERSSAARGRQSSPKGKGGSPTHG